MSATDPADPAVPADPAAPAPAKSPAAPATRVLLRFSLGSFAQAILTGLITSYVMVVFIPEAGSSIPVLLPRAALTFALVRGIGSFLDAVINPLAASWSDRLRSRGGRRTAFLRWAALPWAAATGLAVFTPLPASSPWNTVWVAVFLTLYYVTGAFYLVPYFALVAELVTEVRRRVRLYTMNTFFFVIGSAVVFLTPTIQSVLAGAGFSQLAAWRASFAVFAVIGFVTAILPALTIDERRYVQDAEPAHVPLLKSFAATFRYRNYSVLVAASFVMQFAFAFFNATLLYYVTMLLGQPQSYSTLVLLIAIVIGVASYPLVNLLVNKLGKRPPLVAACTVYVIVYAAIYFYQAALTVVPGPVFAILIAVLIAVPISVTNIVPPAAFADLTQYDTIQTGLNRAGMFFASHNFVVSLSQTAVLLIVPGMIELGSTGGQATVPGVRLTALVATIAIAAALALFAFYDDRHVIAAIAEDATKKQEAAESAAGTS